MIPVSTKTIKTNLLYFFFVSQNCTYKQKICLSPHRGLYNNFSFHENTIKPKTNIFSFPNVVYINKKYIYLCPYLALCNDIIYHQNPWNKFLLCSLLNPHCRLYNDFSFHKKHLKQILYTFSFPNAVCINQKYVYAPIEGYTMTKTPKINFYCAPCLKFSKNNTYMCFSLYFANMQKKGIFMLRA